MLVPFLDRNWFEPVHIIPWIDSGGWIGPDVDVVGVDVIVVRTVVVNQNGPTEKDHHSFDKVDFDSMYLILSLISMRQNFALIFVG